MGMSGNIVRQPEIIHRDIHRVTHWQPHRLARASSRWPARLVACDTARRSHGNPCKSAHERSGLRSSRRQILTYTEVRSARADLTGSVAAGRRHRLDLSPRTRLSATKTKPSHQPPAGSSFLAWSVRRNGWSLTRNHSGSTYQHWE